jgi:Fic family protein
MKLPSPADIELDGVSTQLFDDARELAHQVNELRPVSPEVMDRIEQELLGERVYNSNAIEGNQLTLRETVLVLQSGQSVDVGRRRDATEAANLGKVIANLQGVVADGASWGNRSFFLEQHRVLLTGVNDEYAGMFRDQSVMIRGAMYQPPSETRVYDLMDEVFAHLLRSDGVDPLGLATWTHWAIARIHPFFDGNGRMARLWQDLILFGHRFTAAVIRVTDRDRYYKALSAADDEDAPDFNPLAQLIARSVAANLQVYLNAQRESDELKDWAAEVVGEIHARDNEARQLEYLRWARDMEQVKDAFRRCCTQVTSASDGSIEVQLSSFDVVGQETWESLRSGSGVARTWFFWLNFRRGDHRLNYCFFFNHHVATDADVPGFGPGACLLISEQQGWEGDAMRLDELSDTPLTLRELLTVNDKLARRRIDVLTDRCTYDVDIDPVTVAREFVSEVLLRRLT